MKKVKNAHYHLPENGSHEILNFNKDILIPC